jgi:hypothetical protein
MTIDEAIKELARKVEVIDGRYIPTDPLALQLGIEALKRIKRQRKDLLIHEIISLPGEIVFPMPQSRE